MEKHFSIVTIGSEILDGRIQDTNARTLIHLLEELGLLAHRIVTCDDILSEIVSAFKFASKEVSVVLVTGGLGPTSDDLTREAVAALCGVDLVKDESVLTTLKEFYVRRKREFDSANDKQAYFPRGSTVIPNPTGTAPGFSATFKKERGGECRLFSLPGVPSETVVMMKETVIPEIRRLLPRASDFKKRMIRVFGLPESIVGSVVESCKIPSSFAISYRAAFPEIQVTLKTDGEIGTLERVWNEVSNRLGAEYVFSTDPDLGYEPAILRLLTEKVQTVALAESCTGGMAGEFITSVPGSSSCFRGGIVSYSNEAKMDLLGVPRESIERFGAVSAEVATMMAEGARRALRADIGISITGIAGPDGGTDQKPVGTFFIGLATATKSLAFHRYFNSNRQGIRRFAAYTALDAIRRHLLEFPIYPTHGEAERARQRVLE